MIRIINNDDNNNDNTNTDNNNYNNNNNNNNNDNNDDNKNFKDNNHLRKCDEISVKKSEKFESYEELINYRNYDNIHCLYLLSILTDFDHTIYSKISKYNFLTNIVDNLTLKDLNLNFENLEVVDSKIQNLPLVDIILRNNFFLNISKKLFLYVRNLVQKTRWVELFDENEKMKNKEMQHVVKNFSKMEGNTNSENLKNNLLTLQTIELEKNMFKKKFMLKEGFTIIADMKDKKNENFCDRNFLNKTIERLVKLIRLRLFENQIFENEKKIILDSKGKINDFDEIFLKNKINEMDRCKV